MISTREATVTLDGVTTVTFDRRYPYFAVRNDSSAHVLPFVACLGGKL